MNVNFRVDWNEQGPRITGVYSDNYFATSANVVGTTNAAGRVLQVILPTPVNGVKTITLQTTATGLFNGTIPISISTRNVAGVPVDNPQAQATMSSQVINPSPAPGTTCITGFGALSGFCGLYAGTIAETRDVNNRCSLLGPGATRVELATNLEMRIYFNFQDTLVDIPVHSLGALPASPTSSNVNLRQRTCNAIYGTAFPAQNCKVKNLVGSFLQIGDVHNFTGTYTIIDEVTGQNCNYTMNLNRSQAY
jgi:hypothetical protein